MLRRQRCINSNAQRTYNINYCGSEIQLKSLSELKICGIWYCNDEARAYKLNITDKIIKLENNLKMWRNRNITCGRLIC